MQKTFTRLILPLFEGSQVLRCIGEKLDRVLVNQQRLEESMATAQETIARLTQDVADTHGIVESAITLINGFPDVVRAAVADALAKNPGVDLSPLEAVATDLETEKSRLVEALTVNQTPTTAGTGVTGSDTSAGTGAGGVAPTTDDGSGNPPATE